MSDRTAAAERAGALGMMDLVASLAAGIGALGSAVLLDAAGLGTVSLVAVLLLAAPLVLLLEDLLRRPGAPVGADAPVAGPPTPGGPPL